VQSFESYIAENKDEIDALQFFYSQPTSTGFATRTSALADAIGSPPATGPKRLWQAYEQLDRSRVHGASSGRLLTDIVSLVRFAMHQEKDYSLRRPGARALPELACPAEHISRKFTEEQSQWW